MMTSLFFVLACLLSLGSLQEQENCNRALCGACHLFLSVPQNECCTQPETAQLCGRCLNGAENCDIDKRSSSFWDKRAKFMLGKRPSEFWEKRAKFMLGKRGPAFWDDEEKRAKFMLGKRAKFMLGKRSQFWDKRSDSSAFWEDEKEKKSKRDASAASRMLMDKKQKFMLGKRADV
ncbi:unnamed protein product [Dimorphilus gyrociliatus]|uniref:Uncharacterized protein n=1 Tax=Dimorphilus gyrociliatus TaxID=2664684 RepID=A0A7I8VDQ6_9ANNE|nr:unnamed protein product [Dimorphilus gyrociliatus]